MERSKKAHLSGADLSTSLRSARDDEVRKSVRGDDDRILRVIIKTLPMKRGYVYMMTTRENTALYIGVTSNLSERIRAHRERKIPGFTEKYHCTKLVYLEDSDLVTEAIAREKQLKRWSRAKKNELIERMNPTWDDLTERLEL